MILQFLLILSVSLIIGLAIGLVISIHLYPVWEVSKMHNFFLMQTENNGWVHVQEFADHTNHEIVKPNCDTLYSFVFIDLSKGDYRLTIPAVNDRYVSYCFLSSNTDVLGYINHTNKHLGPEFILTRKKTSSLGSEPILRLDTKLCWIVARFGVANLDEIKSVNKLQRSIKINYEV